MNPPNDDGVGPRQIEEQLDDQHGLDGDEGHRAEFEIAPPVHD